MKKKTTTTKLSKHQIRKRHIDLEKELMVAGGWDVWDNGGGNR